MENIKWWRYKDRSGKSGIARYCIEGDGRIWLDFKDSIYLYTSEKCGVANIETMKALAVEGKNLGTFINRTPQVKDNYENKIEL